jgi:hypothetical protein
MAAMVTFLFTSIFIIGFLALALYFWQKPRTSSSTVALPPPTEPRALFPDPDEKELSAAARDDDAAELRTQLLERARNGDKAALAEANNLQDPQFYDQLLSLLLSTDNSKAGVLSLVSHVARKELPVNKNLALAVLDHWKENPDRNSTAKALHVAALVDDAALYQETVEAALHYQRAGKLKDVSSAELQALFDGEFWVLSSRTRGSGAGFILKRTLANARRELGSATSDSQ